MALQASSASAQLLDPPAVKITKLPSRPNVTYAHTIMSPSDYNISLKVFSPEAEIASIQDRVVCNGLAMTGGFSKRLGQGLVPEGLLRSYGLPFSNLERWRDGGIFSLLNSKPAVTRISAWLRSPVERGLAIQGKPLLVVDGKVDHGLTDTRRQNRVAIGTLSDGNIVFITAVAPNDNAVSYGEFATEALQIVGSKLMALLNLDGGPSAFMLSSQTRILPSNGSVTTYLCAEHK
jgi:hypothetical protein